MNDDLLAPGLPPPDAGDGSPPLRMILMVGGLLVSALGFTLFGLGIALGWWGPNKEPAPEEEPVVAEARSEPEPVPEPEQLAGAELTPVVDPLAPAKEFEPTDTPLPGAEPVPEIAPPSGGGSSSGSNGGGSGGNSGEGGASSGKKWMSQRVKVTLVPKHYDHVEIKLGGKVFTLDGDKTVKIRPGGYRIDLRKSPEAPWRPAGLVDIEVGSSYRVTLLDPPLAKLETLK